VIDVFHGKELSKLELADVQALLDDARAEPLHWEAKGVKIKAGEIREQICGFANSLDGGYLILGTEVRDGSWVLDGAEFPNDDLPNWISSLAVGVQPYPEGLDTRPIEVGGGRWIAVVWIPPTPTPPCNAHGTVYERVSGATRSVREPLRLSELVTRGQTAHVNAEWQARHAAERVFAFATTLWHSPAENISVALGLRAVAYGDELEAAVFSTDMMDLLLNTVPGFLGHDGKDLLVEHRQDAVLVYPYRPVAARSESEWVVHVAWDGSVGVACRQVGVDLVTKAEFLVDYPVRKAWELAASSMSLLQPRGPAYMRIMLRGKQFDEPRIAEPELSSSITGWRPGQIDRGPIDIAVSDEVLAGITREVCRLLGYERAFEPRSHGISEPAQGD
jgi:hypothetical protein